MDMSLEMENIVFKNANKFAEFIDKDMCRACLTNKDLQPLFVEQDNCLDAGNAILNMFILCTSLEASWNDQYPKHICYMCLEELFKAYDFWRKCRSSFEKLSALTEGKSMGQFDILHYQFDKKLDDEYSSNEEKVVELLNISNVIKEEPDLDNRNILEEKHIVDDESSQELGTTKDDTKLKIIEQCDSSFYFNSWEKNKYEDQEMNNVLRTLKDFSDTFNISSSDNVSELKKKIRNHKMKLTRSKANLKRINKELDNHKQGLTRRKMNLKTGDLIVCEICSKKYKSYTGYQIHKRTHTGERPYSCNLCSMSFKSPNELRNHKYEHEDKKIYLCKYCKKPFDDKNILEKHMSFHYGSFLCQICGSSFNTAKYLQVHSALHSDLRPYKCKTCDKSFKARTTLDNHELIHTGIKKYACHFCEKKFTTCTLRRTHERVSHETARPHKCRICPKTFKRPCQLKFHEKLHTGEKPHQCSLCVMNFVTMYALKKHMVKHTGERNFSCTLCDKRFSRASVVKQHMVTHTGERRFKCEICSKAFTQAHVMRNHMKKIHSKDKMSS